MTDDETQPAKKQKGGKYPKGVSETGRKNNIKFQARVGCKPNPDGKTVQRSAAVLELSKRQHGLLSSPWTALAS